MQLNVILPGLLLLGVVIFVHELGHFLVAKWRGVRVIKFSLGMGPEMVGFTRGDTRYCISWVPLGGFVQMAGDSPNDDGTMPEGGPDQFLSHPWFGRMLIAFAGPTANLITGFLVLILVFIVGVSRPDFEARLGTVPETSPAYAAGLRDDDRVVAVNGAPVSTWHEMDSVATAAPKTAAVAMRLLRAGTPLEITIPPEQRRPVFQELVPAFHSAAVVGNVITGYPAYKAGLKAGDLIRAVDGKAVHSWIELLPALHGKVDRKVVLNVTRQGQTFDLTVTPISSDLKRGSQNAVIGIEPPRGMTYMERSSPGEAVVNAWYSTGALIAQVYSSMWLAISHPLYYREMLGGPIFIAQMAHEQAKKGLDTYLYILAMINFAIMAFNLLPIPLLDGGHIALALLQAVRHRAISARAYLNFQKVGLVVVGTLFIFILSNDVLRLVQRQRAVKAPPETHTVAPTPP